MKRQDYYPKTIAAQVLWLHQFARNLSQLDQTYGLTPEEIALGTADALWLAHVVGSWRTALRALTRSGPAFIELAQTGSGTEPLMLPELGAPALPAGVEPRPAGALNRVFKLVRRLKINRNFLQTHGSQFAVVTLPDSAEHPVPTFKIRVKAGPGNQHVIIRYSKHGRDGVVIESRRAGGDWEQLRIHMASLFEDKRPLLTPGQPELRDYRLRYFEDAHPTGDWTAVATVMVGP